MGGIERGLARYACISGLYVPSFTPITNIGASAEGAVMTTRCRNLVASVAVEMERAVWRR